MKSVERKEEARKKIIADASPELAKPGYISQKLTGHAESGNRRRKADPGESMNSESKAEESSMLISPRSPLPPRVARSPESPGTEVFHFQPEATQQVKMEEETRVLSENVHQQSST